MSELPNKENFIKRDLLNDLRYHLSKKQISLIVGPRQSGKTTLMFKLKEELEQRGESVAYLSMDSSPEFFETQQKLINYLELNLGNEGFVFLDEVQRKENAGLFLKGVYDYIQHKDLNYKFVVSGSGSLELKEKIHESLAGRKLIFELNPLSFIEFVNYKTGYKYENQLKKFFEIEKVKFFSLLSEYLNFGGYPNVVKTKKLEDKIRIIDEIVESYLEKDVSSLLNVKKKKAFRNMLEILSGQTGNLINYSKLSSSLNISSSTLENYLYYAEKTFVIKLIKPFFRNKKKEIVKSPVVYFNDLGLRNYLYGVFGNISNEDSGFSFENLIANFLLHKFRFLPENVYFWRTQTGAEVDFIVSSKAGKELIPIEVKFSDIKESKVGKSLHSFIEKYNPDRAIVVNKSSNKEINIKNTNVKFVSINKFIQLEELEETL